MWSGNYRCRHYRPSSCIPTFALAPQRGLEARLAKATAKLQALTPKPGPGKCQIIDIAVLKSKADAILKQHRVQDLLAYESTTATHGGKTRYVITAVTPELAKIQAQIHHLGWRAYGTDAPLSRLSWEAAVITYRDEWIVEHSFSRLKGTALAVAPPFVQRDDQVVGLVNLMSLALRLLSLIEFVVRHNLKQPLRGLKPHKPQETTAKPTAESLLEAFSNLTLTTIRLPDQQICHVTTLTRLQQQILFLLELSPDIYRKLWILAGAVEHTENFDSLPFHPIDHQVGATQNYQLLCAIHSTRATYGRITG
jgi:transposase